MSDLPSWKGAKRVAFDTETCDPKLRTMGIGVRRGGFMAGFSFAIEDGPSHYVPLRHFGGDNVEDPAAALRYLAEQAKYFDGDLCGANLPYDLDYSAEVGVVFPKVRFFRDIQIADPLIYELHNSYTMDAIAARWNLPGKDETLLRRAALEHGVDPKADLWKLPARYVGAYAEQDTRLPLQILRKQEREIEEQDLWRVYDLESRVLPVLLKMRRRGVRVDVERLDRIEAWTIAEEEKALKDLHRESGRRLMLGEVNKNAALAPILKQIGVTLPKTAKGADSIDQAVLAGIQHPIARAIERARKVNKLRTTFVASVRNYMTGGRIHTTFNQMPRPKNEADDATTGARFGRLSSVNPNLQQQPSRDEFAKEWRSIYLPEVGKQWASIDLSSQEPRLVIHFSVVSGPRLIGMEAWQAAKQMAARYWTDPSTDFHQATADCTGGRLTRKQSKPVGLGLCYAMGEKKLCLTLGLPTTWAVYDSETREKVYQDQDPEAFRRITQQEDARPFPAAGEAGRSVLAAFNGGAPYIKALAKSCSTVAMERGYIVTLLGRHCRFPEKPLEERKGKKDKYEWAHKAISRLIQGSAGDQAKKALVDLDAAGHEIQLQIHDEVTGSVDGEKQAREMADIIENCVTLEVPSKTDVELGRSWGESAG